MIRFDRPERPSLAELRGRVHKEQHKTIGNWVARKIARPSAVYGTWLAVRLGLTAHQVTCLAWLAAMVSAVSLGWGTTVTLVVGVGLGWLAFWLDRVDGQVARWRGSSSLDGVYFDYLMHHAAIACQGFALGFAMARREGSVGWSAAGFAVALGWTFLNLHNDCRYKAFFQRLKCGTGQYVVTCGSAERSEPAPGWPRSGRGLLTWPLAKACEPHVVLLALTALIPLLVVSEPAGWMTLGIYVAGMAILAPLIAAGRIARAIRSGSIERDFGRWFEPLESSETQGRPGRRNIDPAHAIDD